MRSLVRPLPLRLQVLGSILAVLLPSTVVMFFYYPYRQEQIARAAGVAVPPSSLEKMTLYL